MEPTDYNNGSAAASNNILSVWRWKSDNLNNKNAEKRNELAQIQPEIPSPTSAPTSLSLCSNSSPMPSSPASQIMNITPLTPNSNFREQIPFSSSAKPTENLKFPILTSPPPPPPTPLFYNSVMTPVMASSLAFPSYPIITSTLHNSLSPISMSSLFSPIQISPSSSHFVPMSNSATFVKHNQLTPMRNSNSVHDSSKPRSSLLLEKPVAVSPPTSTGKPSSFKFYGNVSPSTSDNNVPGSPTLQHKVASIQKEQCSTPITLTSQVSSSRKNGNLRSNPTLVNATVNCLQTNVAAQLLSKSTCKSAKFSKSGNDLLSQTPNFSRNVSCFAFSKFFTQYPNLHNKMFVQKLFLLRAYLQFCQSYQHCVKGPIRMWRPLPCNKKLLAKDRLVATI